METMNEAKAGGKDLKEEENIDSVKRQYCTENGDVIQLPMNSVDKVAAQRRDKTGTLKKNDVLNWLAAYRLRKLHELDLRDRKSHDDQPQEETSEATSSTRLLSEDQSQFKEALHACFTSDNHPANTQGQESGQMKSITSTSLEKQPANSVEDQGQPKRNPRTRAMLNHTASDNESIDRLQNAITDILSPSQSPSKPKPERPTRSFFADLNDPNMMRYKMVMNNWIVYKRYVAELGHEAAFQRTKDEVGERAALVIRGNYHQLMGNSFAPL